MNLFRNVFEELESWRLSPHRKPLLVFGARQVGKTWALKTLGSKAYRNVVYLNFEERPKTKSIFQQELDPHIILANIRRELHETIEPEHTLVIFDEIQECPEALTSLKYFCEKTPKIHLAAAGSLLGVKLKSDTAFPVGKVNIIDIYPMSFSEFLSATGEQGLVDLIRELPAFGNIPETFHLRLIQNLRSYFFVGGMPEAVAHYVDQETGLHTLLEIRDIQRDILRSYELDIAKHAPKDQVQKIFAVWQSILGQISKENRKFQYSKIERGARSRSHEIALQWLIDAGLVLKCFHLTTAKSPLSAYADADYFKIFFLDVGLLSCLADLPMDSKLSFENDAFSFFKGALTENFVAQEILQHLGKPLYYWSSGNQAEVDFVIEREGRVLPLEVKAGINLRSKSLISFGHKFRSKILCRTSLKGFEKNGIYHNYPLYGLDRFPGMSLKSE